jgi:putative phosphonate metabolism protein
MNDHDASTSRYAIYFSPDPTTSVAHLGDDWLGRHQDSENVLSPELPQEISSDEWRRATESARRYSFHATLKPPFRLAEGYSPDDLKHAMRTFAISKSTFFTPHLVVGTLGHFLALVLSKDSTELSDLANECVREFERFRAPASESEIAKRSNSSLSQREQEHLLKWGYPYVFDTWKFHMTLTSSLERGPLEVFEQHLRYRFAKVCVDLLPVDSICLCEEAGPGNPFQVIERIKLGI